MAFFVRIQLEMVLNLPHHSLKPEKSKIRIFNCILTQRKKFFPIYTSFVEVLTVQYLILTMILLSLLYAMLVKGARLFTAGQFDPLTYRRHY